MIIQAFIPDYLIRQAEDVARRMSAETAIRNVNPITLSRYSLLIVALSLPLSVTSKAEPVDQSENVQHHIKHSDFIVDTCIYEQEWIPATPEFPKAKLVKRAVVTGVYKGDIQIGTKLESYHLIEDPPRLFKTTFRSVVDGELRTFFFSRDDGTFKNGRYSLEGDGHFGFDRCKGDFADAFRKELKSNLDMKHPSGEVVLPRGP